MPNLFKLRKLSVGDTRKSNIDLAHLAAFEDLERLILSGQAKNVAATAHLKKLTRLGIYCFRNKIDLKFLSKIPNLEFLRILLGGRSDIDEASIPSLRWLMIDRVRGFGRVDLNRFPNLNEFTVEDQLQLREIDLTPVTRNLARLRLWNCKNLGQLVGLSRMESLLQLRIGQTALNLDAVIADLPRSARGVSLYGKSSKHDAEIRTRLQAAGYSESSYAIDPFFP